jgi:predicted amidohydrolase
VQRDVEKAELMVAPSAASWAVHWAVHWAKLMAARSVDCSAATRAFEMAFY